MSLGLKIVPTAPLPTWGAVRQHIDARNLRLRLLGGEALKDGDRIELGAAYGFEGDELEPLHLFPSLSRERALVPADWLDDLGQNLANREDVAAAWDRAGYYFTLESRSAPGGDDIPLVAHIASALADAVSGYVCVSTRTGFGLREGTYRPDEFRSAHHL